MPKKYIRTEDGRITEVKDNMFVKQSDVLRLVYKDNPCICVLQGEDDIIAEADTIKELCDCFLAVRKNASGTYSVFFIEFEDWKTWISGYVIYGAIYTDKGLIYVAKLNSKGELELL